MAIYGEPARKLAEAQILQEKFKLFEFLKKKKPSKFKPVQNQEIKKITEKFKEDYKLTTEVVTNVNIFNVIKTKEDFDKMIKATGTSHTKEDSEVIFYTYCYVYDYPDNPVDIKGLIDVIKNDKHDLNTHEEYNKDAIKILGFAAQNKLIALSLTSSSLMATAISASAFSQKSFIVALSKLFSPSSGITAATFSSSSSSYSG